MKSHSKIILGKKPYHPRDPVKERAPIEGFGGRYFSYENQGFKLVDRDLDGQLSTNLFRLNSRKGKRPLVVDLGCGTARTAAEAAEKHPHVDVLAFSGHYYPEWEAYQHPNLTLFHGSLDELHEKLKERPADLVYSELGALPDRTEGHVEFIQNLRPHLAPRGKLLFFPSMRPHGPDPKFWKRLVDLKKSGYHIGFNKDKRWFSAERVD